jgi:hypothetical protein
LPENGNNSQLPKHCVTLRRLMMDKVPKKKIMSGNFLYAVFSLLDFFTLKAGTDGLSQNIGAELTPPCILSQSADLTRSCDAAMVCLHMAQYKARNGSALQK